MKESENKLDDARIEKIKRDFNELKDRFFESTIKEIRNNLYRIENIKNLSTRKIKGIEKNLLKLENNLLNWKSIMIMMILNTKE